MRVYLAATSEAFGGTDCFNFFKSYLGMPLLDGNKVDNEIHFYFKCGYRSESSLVIPYLEDDNLVFLVKTDDESGNNVSQLEGTAFEGQYKKSIIYTPDGLVPALRANYRLFSRDRTKMVRIMEYFNEVNN